MGVDVRLPASLLVVLVGLVGIAAYLPIATTPVGALLYDAMAFGAAATILVRVRRGRPADPAPWLHFMRLNGRPASPSDKDAGLSIAGPIDAAVLTGLAG